MDERTVSNGYRKRADLSLYLSEEQSCICREANDLLDETANW